MKINKLSALALCSLMSIATSAQSALVNFTLSGQIDLAETSNPFGVAVGDTITALGVFDDSEIAATGESLVDFSTSYNNMDINIGDITFTDAMDTYFGGAYLYFSDGVFTGLDYYSESQSMTISSSAEPGFFINGGISDSIDPTTLLETTYIEGTWNPESFTVTAVPVPAAIWLFGSGLLLLTGFTRRKIKL